MPRHSTKRPNFESKADLHRTIARAQLTISEQARTIWRLRREVYELQCALHKARRRIMPGTLILLALGVVLVALAWRFGIGGN